MGALSPSRLMDGLGANQLMEDLEPLTWPEDYRSRHGLKFRLLSQDSLIGGNEVPSVFACFEYVCCIGFVFFWLAISSEDFVENNFPFDLVRCKRCGDCIDHTGSLTFHVGWCVEMLDFLLIRVGHHEINLPFVPERPKTLSALMLRCVLRIEGTRIKKVVRASRVEVALAEGSSGH